MKLSLDELEKLSSCVDTSAEEKRLRTSLKIDKKYSKALVIGRFQPLHRGHVYLLQCALAVADSVIIGIGSSGLKNVDNPFSLETRKVVLERVLKRENIEKYVDKLVDVPDYPDDEVWRKEVEKKVGDFDIVVGNNDWVNGIFEKVGYPVLTIPLLKRDVYEGKTIRQHLREEGKL